MKRTIFLIFIVTIISAVGCDDDVVVITEKNFPFNGIVIDSMTKQPIDVVAIKLYDTIRNPNTYTDSLGIFNSEIWGGYGTVFAQKEGYNTKSQLVDISNNLDSLLFELVKQ